MKCAALQTFQNGNQNGNKSEWNGIENTKWRKETMNVTLNVEIG
jgi:hypothetical protein